MAGTQHSGNHFRIWLHRVAFVALPLLVALTVMAVSGYAPEATGSPGTVKAIDETGKVVDILPIVPEREGGARVIDSLGLWSLEKLGYSDLTFPCEDLPEAISIEYTLPENASQGPEDWYVIYLHFSIEFSGQSDNGSAYLSAATNSYACAQIKFETERENDSLIVNWITGSENLFKGDINHSTSSLNIEDVHFANYLPISGVVPGQNFLTFKLEQYDGAKVSGLRIFGDSGIALTLQPAPGGENLSEGYLPSPPFMVANPEDIDPEYPAGPRPEIPTLTEEEEAWAIETALSDPRVQELVSGKEYVIGAIGVVHTTELEKTGAGLHICFEEPYWIEYDWPSQERTFHLGLDVLTLAILVDFEAGGVVEIMPLDISVGESE